MEEQYLFAFLDILGTKSLVKSGEFGDLHSLDFVNPVGIAAQLIPTVRFAAFSDCVMISAPAEKHRNFISAISFCYSNWCADHIFVRGGISLGELYWVDDAITDRGFKKLKNFTYARIYGKALVSAYMLEESSGPGIMCFVDENASDYLKESSNNYVLSGGQTDTLIWCKKSEAVHLNKVFSFLCDKTQKNSEKRKQFKATVNYFKALSEKNLYLPDDFD